MAGGGIFIYFMSKGIFRQIQHYVPAEISRIHLEMFQFYDVLFDFRYIFQRLLLLID